MFFGAHMYAFLQGLCLRVNSLDHEAGSHSASANTAEVVPVTLPPGVQSIPAVLCLCQHVLVLVKAIILK